MKKASNSAVAVVALTIAATVWGSTASRAESLVFVAEAPFPLEHAESYKVTPGEDFVRVERNTTLLPSERWIAGVSVDKSFEAAFGGQEIEVSITARAVGATSSYKAVYFTLGNGNSGQHQMTVTKEFSSSSFRYVVPKVGTPGGDYIGIDTAPGEGVEIKSIAAKVVPAS